MNGFRFLMAVGLFGLIAMAGAAFTANGIAYQRSRTPECRPAPAPTPNSASEGGER